MPDDIYSVYYNDINASEKIGDHLYTLLLNLLESKKYKTIKVICIGTDRSSGDCLGPLVGTFLSENLDIEYLDILGTVDDPVHAGNIENICNDIRDDDLVIAIDASLTEVKVNVGNISIGLGPIKPGSGVGKDLPEIGDVNIYTIIGLLESDAYDNFCNLINMNLNEIYNVAGVVSNCLKNAFLKLDNYIKENTNLGFKLEPLSKPPKEIIYVNQVEQCLELKKDIISKLNRKLALIKTGKYKSILVLNLGDRCGTGNSLGPLIGDSLSKNIKHPNIKVFGTMEDPLIIENLPTIIRNIEPDDFVITIRPGLTFNSSRIGTVELLDKVNFFSENIDKKLSRESKINISGLINIGFPFNDIDFVVMNCTSLSVILQLAKVIAEGLEKTLPNYLPYLKDNNNLTSKKQLVLKNKIDN
ncbi:MAG: spore protease YyaC [Bacilli bacterium]|nr:spore protease YyaC [Bacilli bacterium]